MINPSVGSSEDVVLYWQELAQEKSTNGRVNRGHEAATTSLFPALAVLRISSALPQIVQCALPRTSPTGISAFSILVSSVASQV